MIDDLRTRIATVQAKHHHWDYAGALTCACGETFGLGVEAGWEAAVAGWAAHVADAVIRELELHYQYENGRVMYDTKPAACKPNGLWKYRIVSPHKEYM